MYVRRNESRGTILAPAKLNLFLEVLGRRQDGLHNIATLMVPIRLWDSLLFQTVRSLDRQAPATIDLTVEYAYPDGEIEGDIPDGDTNLVVRALRLLQERSGCGHGASVRLVKRIPSAAGLGGGSSDAAASLLLANELWNLGWNRSRLGELAAEVGSDVPFFLEGGAAICSGRGEVVEGLGPLPPLHFVVVKPPTGLDSAAVYHALKGHSQFSFAECRARMAKLIDHIRHGKWTNLGQLMSNGMESAAAGLSPWIECLREAFQGMDVVAHQLSGSGTAYFGLCRNARQARCLAGRLKSQRIGNVYPVCSCP